MDDLRRSGSSVFGVVASRPTHSHRITNEMKLTRTNGCGIRRLVSLCGTVTQLVAEYDRWLLEPESDDDDDLDDDEVPPETKAEVQRLAFLDILLTRCVPRELTGTPQASRPRLSIISRACEVGPLANGEGCRPGRGVEDTVSRARQLILEPATRACSPFPSSATRWR